MPTVDVRFDDRAIALQLRALREDVIDRATVRALNRTVTSVRAEAVKRVRAVLPVAAKPVRNRLKLRRATRASLEASVRVPRDWNPSLSLFSPRWQQRQAVGATVKVGRGPRVAVPGTFTAATRYGRVGVFRRAGAQRKPIVWQRATDAGLPTLAQSFLQDEVQRAMARRARERFEAEFRREIAFRRAG